MKIYLDDERPTPEGWIRCYWPQEVISYLQTGNVEELSLDHDLGDSEAAARELRKERTGYDVIEWIEEMVYNNALRPPHIKIHSANPTGRLKMQAGIKCIHHWHALNRSLNNP